MNIFVAFPGESVSSFLDKFTSFVRSVPTHRINDESLKDYFYRLQYDNNKEVFDTIVCGFYGECTYGDIMEKLEKISCTSKAWITRK